MDARTFICNQALTRLGEKPIQNLTEGTRVADACASLYTSCRDVLLAWQAWPFATLRQPLVRLSAIPASDFAYYYALPTQPPIIRVIDLDLDNQRLPYQREVYVNPFDPLDQKSVIATDATTAVMRYIGETLEHIWSPLFTATLVVYLAQALAPAVSGKASLKQLFLAELYGQGSEPGLMQKLRDTAGYEDSPRVMPLPAAYLTVRESMGESAPTRLWW